ncbi:MAG: aspartate dehydrogenase [Clostridiales bacterium]|nr:aspartate dehydrogenase [Clostridiales bacterium]
MFGKKKKQEPEYPEFDLSVWKPFLRCSICTGEQTVGFKNRETGEVAEIGVITNPGELDRLKKFYGVDEFEKVY